MPAAFGAPAFYRLAGQVIFFNPAVPELQPFRLDNNFRTHPCLPDDLSDLVDAGPAIQINGALADRISSISVWQNGQGTLLEIPAAGRFWIAADGAAIIQVTQPPGADLVFHSQSILGPPLILALALRDTWCLHASAIIYAGKVIAFLGISGAGKSTLAASLMRQPGTRRVSDDILAVHWQAGALAALPHFPQLKLPDGQQPGFEFPDNLPLAAIYVLDEQPQISILALDGGKPALNLAGHTVAARLFNRQLLSEHLSFCARVASDIPIRNLAYPRKLSLLPSVWQTLKDDLADLLA